MSILLPFAFLKRLTQTRAKTATLLDLTQSFCQSAQVKAQHVAAMPVLAYAFGQVYNFCLIACVLVVFRKQSVPLLALSININIGVASAVRVWHALDLRNLQSQHQALMTSGQESYTSLASVALPS